MFNSVIRQITELFQIIDYLIEFRYRNDITNEDDIKLKNSLLLSVSNNLSEIISELKPELMIKVFLFKGNNINIKNIFSYFYVLKEIYSISKCNNYQQKSFFYFLKNLELFKKEDIEIIKKIMKNILNFNINVNINQIISFNFIKILFPMSILTIFKPFLKIDNYNEDDLKLINHDYLKENIKMNYLEINLNLLDLVRDILYEIQYLSIFDLELKIDNKTLQETYYQFLDNVDINYDELNNKLQYFQNFWKDNKNI